MTLDETTQLYASVLRQLLPTGGYDTSPNTEALAVDVYAHAKLLAQADLDAKRLLNVLEGFPPELINEYETEYGLPLKCSINAGKTLEERIDLLKWVRSTRNVLNKAYLEQILAIFGVVLIDIVKFKPMQCTAPCNSAVNTEQLRYKVLLKLQYPVEADMNCIIDNYLPGYLRIDVETKLPIAWNIVSVDIIDDTIQFTAFKREHEYYDSWANIDILSVVQYALHAAEIQKDPAIVDAIHTLVDTEEWRFSNNNKRIEFQSIAKKAFDANYSYKIVSGITSLDQLITYANSTDWTASQGPFGLAGNTIVTPARGKAILIKDELYVDDLSTIHSLKFDISHDDGAVFYFNGELISSFNESSGSSITIPLDKIRLGLNTIFFGVVDTVPTGTPASIFAGLSSEINFTDHRTYLEVAHQVLSHYQNLNSNYSINAGELLNKLANSVNASDTTKQFIRLADLVSIFEENQYLRNAFDAPVDLLCYEDTSVHISWTLNGSVAKQYIYISEQAFGVNNLPNAIIDITNQRSFNFLPSRSATKYYFCIASSVGTMMKFSEIISLDIAPLPQLVSEYNADRNAIISTWSLTNDADEIAYYCSETPIETTNLPVVKATLTGDARSYIDTSIEMGKTYYVAVISIKNGIQKISETITITAFAENQMNGGIEDIITINGINYKVHTFNNSGFLEVISASSPINLLVVGGGGSGAVFGGGGGGGGGVVNIDNLTLSSGTYAVTVGVGAQEHPYATTGGTGETSEFISPTSNVIAKATGGTGGNSGGGGQSGGNSGAGYFNNMLVQPSIAGAGANTSGNLNGGAGAGAQADHTGGGAGLLVNGYYYGAGGGSGQRSAGGSGWKGGISGGGNGLYGENQGSSTAGTPNSGGGGGGSWGNYIGQNGGGSGVVKIMYQLLET